MNKKILLIMFCMILLISFASAVVKQYDKETQTIKIKHSFLGIPTGKIADVQLNTPLVYKVARGYNLVAEFTINSYEDYNDAFEKIDFYNLNDDLKTLSRNYDYKYKTIVKTEIEDYNYVCSKPYDCVKQLVGSHFEDKIVWKDLPSSNFLDKQEITIGIFTDVQRGDHVEWIPTFYGKEINEWAVFEESLKVDLVAYWKMDELSGTIADSVGSNDGTNNGATAGVNGIIKTAYRLESANNDDIRVGSDTIDLTDQPLTINAWVNLTDISATRSVFGSFRSRGYGVFITDDGAINFGLIAVDAVSSGTDAILTSSFQMVTVLYNSSGVFYYVNGTGIDNDAYSNTFDADVEYAIGKTNASYMNGVVDEVGVWKRALTNSEITDLYNGGEGLTIDNPPIITLNSPSNNLDTLDTEITFNATVNGEIKEIINASLKINGTYIETNSSGINGTNYIFTSTLPFGSHNWTIESCNNESLCSSATVRNLNVSRIVVNSRTFSNLTIEGTTEAFILNYSIGEDFQTSTVNLVYNGTAQSSTITSSSGIVIAKNNLAILNVDSNTNVNFYWSITLTNGLIINTTTSTQFINFLSIDDCDSNTNLVYNYTLYNEETQVKLSNTSIDIEVEIFDISGSTSILNFSKEYDGTENPAKVCLNIALLNTTDYSLDSTVKYSANDSGNSYAVEYYNILNFTLSNSSIPNHIALYDLLLDDSTEFQLTFKDSNLALFPNILVNVNRKYVSDGDFKTVEIPLTDSNGQTVLHLVRNDIVYNFIMINSNGKIVAVFNEIIAFCQDFTIGSCSIKLNEPTTEEQFYDNLEDVGISSSISYSNVTEVLSLDFVSNDLTTKTVIFEVIRNNDFGNRSVCSESLTASSGIIGCDLSTIVETDRFLFVNIYVGGELKSTETIDLETDIKGYGVEGYFIAFIFILLLITIFMEDKQVLIISLGIGWVAIISFGLVKGALFGSVSAGIWLIVCIIIFLWKLKKEKT